MDTFVGAVLFLQYVTDSTGNYKTTALTTTTTGSVITTVVALRQILAQSARLVVWRCFAVHLRAGRERAVLAGAVAVGCRVVA